MKLKIFKFLKLSKKYQRNHNYNSLSTPVGEAFVSPYLAKESLKKSHRTLRTVSSFEQDKYIKFVKEKKDQRGINYETLVERELKLEFPNLEKIPFSSTFKTPNFKIELKASMKSIFNKLNFIDGLTVINPQKENEFFYDEFHYVILIETKASISNFETAQDQVESYLENPENQNHLQNKKVLRMIIFNGPDIDFAYDKKKMKKKENMMKVEEFWVCCHFEITSKLLKAFDQLDKLSNDNIRLSNENIRLSNENIFIKQEITRLSNENIILSNENIRLSNENTVFKQEITRLSNENIILSNDNIRLSNDNIRISNENIRISNENTVLNKG